MQIWAPPEPHSPATWREDLMALHDRTQWKQGEEKLLYWGLSYGTIVGATFAAMQPYRIERAIIDGVADSPDYYRGKWSTNLDDTDVLLDKFSKYCYKSGLGNCALYTEGSAQGIKQFFINTVNSLKVNPIGVPANGALAPDLITYTNLKWMVREAVYSPPPILAPSRSTPSRSLPQERYLLCHLKTTFIPQILPGARMP